MTGRPRSRVLVLAALVAAVVASVLRLGGVDTDVLLWAAPVALLVAPLALGRFVGEEALAARRRARRPKRQRRRAGIVAAIPRRTPRVAGHRGLLLAFRLAERGPPALVAAA
jgi:hypothetical protein